jgi:hypothetical protein
MNPDNAVSLPAFGRRIAIHLIVLGMHLGLVMVLFRSPASRTHGEAREGRPQDALMIRFIHVVAHHVPERMHAAQATRTRKRSTTMRQVFVEVDAAVAAREAAQAIDTTPSTDVPTANSVPLAGYIPGGNLLSGGYPIYHGSSRLPGSSTPIMPGIQMIDSRTQGIGGVVRKVQALLGVPDRHCVDVDAWRGMSTRELLDRHISPDQVDGMAAEYNCLPRRA